MAQDQDIIILGAGIAGLTCADKLHNHGIRTKVLEKSNGVGGRMATRRLQGTWVDHGTQYFSVSDHTFARFVNRLLDIGIIQLWETAPYQLKQGRLHAPPPQDNQARYICTGGMTAIAKYIARPLQTSEAILPNVRITAAATSAGKWQLKSEHQEIFSAPIVVSTIPAPQVLPIFSKPLTANPAFADTIASVEFLPSLAIMAGYDPSHTVPPEWYAIRTPDDPTLSWICLNSAKAGQTDTAPVFVCHSSLAYAQATLKETNLETAGKPMLTQLGKILANWLATPLWWQAHRWRYALVDQPLSTPCLITTKPLPLICAGDWCGGNNLQSAYLSGLAAADAVLDLLGKN